MSHIINSYLVHIRSKDCNFLVNEDTRTSIELYLKDSIRCDETQQFILSVQSLEVPFSFYQINQNNNNFYFQESIINADGTLTPQTFYSYPIDHGNYNVNELKTLINDILNLFSVDNIDKPYKIDYSATTNKLKFKTASTETQCEIFFNDQNIITKLASIGITTTETYSVRRNLGFTKHNDYTINHTSNVISDSRVNLVSIHSLYVQTNLSLGNTIISKTLTNSSVLAKIPINQNYNSMIFYRRIEGQGLNWISNRQIQRLTLTLTDQDSNLIILGDDIDWECTLQFDVIDNNNPMNALDYRSKVDAVEYDEMEEDAYNNVYSGDADIGEIEKNRLEIDTIENGIKSYKEIIKEL